MDRTSFTNPFEVLEKLQEEQEEDKHDNNTENTGKKKRKKVKKEPTLQLPPQEAPPTSERDYRTRISHNTSSITSSITGNQQDTTTTTTTFSILSYNILAQHYVKTNFPYCKQKYLNFDYRNENVMNELSHYNADIMCLQVLYLHITVHSLTSMTRK